ncbi:RNA methyltransferase [Apibacter muscae]|uniref:RNA methyltransferase n=2 Tax=Apibacter muscae TaxID=2509004 RepID=A0A563DK94_9FLAO|nr:RNA methyltransferase [Apibacter muscae]TWP31211.1 RNA methyltransferase [Apibacter muscae]
MKMTIESDKNPKIKKLLKLIEKSRERKIQNKIIVEGVQENFFALQNNYDPIEFFIQTSIFQNNINIPKNIQIYEVSKQVYSKIAYRQSTEGIVGVYRQKEEELKKIKLKKDPFLVIIESIEKPGNLGAICRSVDAFGVDYLFVCDEKVDIYNPNVIRSSVGSVFNVPIIHVANQELYEFLKDRKINTYATFMNMDFKEIQEISLDQSTAIIFGTEHSGVSNFWKDKITENILIPMQGKVDSLNISNAVSISCYEVRRQRGINKK